VLKSTETARIFYEEFFTSAVVSLGRDGLKPIRDGCSTGKNGRFRSNRKQESKMKRKIFLRKVLCAVFLLLAAVLAASAQAGRRINKTPTPQPTPEPTTPQPTPTPKPEIKPEIKFRVVADIPLTVFQDFTRPEDVARWIVQRLENSPLIEIKSNVSGTQKKAKEIAVASADEYVVYIQFNVNSTFSGGGARTGAGDVWIEYAVLLPQTGKNKLRDRVFLRQGGVSQSRRVCYPSMRYADYMLLQASIEVADNIMAKFNLPLPAEKCGSRALNLLKIAEPSRFQTSIMYES
jgi:hypothetical protein